MQDIFSPLILTLTDIISLYYAYYSIDIEKIIFFLGCAIVQFMISIYLIVTK